MVHDSTDTEPIVAYVDASFFVHSDGNSQSGLIILYYGGTIATNSTKQGMVSQSSRESELIALLDYYTWIIQLHECLKEIGIVTAVPVIHQHPKRKCYRVTHLETFFTSDKTSQSENNMCCR